MPSRNMTVDTLTRMVRESITNSSWFDSTESQGHMKSALDSYYGRDKLKTTDGRSTARSHDFADMVEAVVAQIMPAFDFDEVAVFDPDGRDDVDQARLESLVCNIYLRDRNEGYVCIQEAVRNALMARNGILKIYPETRVRTETRRYDRELGPVELAAQLEPASPRERRELLRNEDGAAAIRITTEFRRLNIECTDTTNFLITRNFSGHNVQDAPMCGERYFMTRSDLIARGISKRTVMELAKVDTDTRIASTSRNADVNMNFHLGSQADKSQELIEVFELYPLVDFDQDGVAERYRILYAGGAENGQILERVPAWGVPYATGTGFLQPNRWEGLDLYDKLREVEYVKTETLRQYLDNMAYINNNEIIARDGDVNMADLEARRPGGIIRADATDAAVPLPVQDLSGASRGLLDYMDKVRSERGGASLDLQAAELQLAGETAHGVERQYTSKEALAQLITRTLAETMVRQAFWLIHETLRRELPERAEVRLGNQFITAEPGSWRYRDRITIVAGMSFAERQKRQEVLGAILMQQEKLTMAGFGDGILTDLQTYHDTLLDWTAAGGVSHARRYWIDPRSDQSQQAQAGKQQQAQAEAERNEQLQAALFTTQVRLQQLEDSRQRWEHSTELRFKYWKETLDSMVEELRIDAQSGNVTHNAEPAEVDAQQRTGTNG